MENQNKIKKILKAISRWLGGFLFSLAFILLFTNLFVSSLVQNTDVLQESLNEELQESDFLTDQLIQNSGTSEEELKQFCNLNPQEELCQTLNNPSEILTESIGLDALDESLQPVKDGLSISVLPIIILFILSLVFYFLGSLSFYGILFKISLNAFLSSLSAFIMFGIFPSQIPSLFNLIEIPDVPSELQSILVNSLDSWFQVALSTTQTIFIGALAASAASSIIFYFLKKKHTT